jgi:hypothetical protein
MKNTILYSFILISGLMGLTSCEDPIDLNLGVPANQMVIDAVIDQTTDTQFIYIRRTKPFLEDGNYAGIQVDTVGIVDTANQTFYKFTYKGDGTYFYVPATNTFKYGNAYQLLVKEGSQTYFSQSVLNSPTSIDSLTYRYEERGRFGGNKGNYITVWAKDKPGIGDFYWFKVYRNDSFQAKANNIVIASDNAFNQDGNGDGDLFIVPIREGLTGRPLKQGEKMKVEILSITPELYFYLNLISTQLNNQGLFATPPTNIPSNIVCLNNPDYKILGFFSFVGKVESNELIVQ